jgi:hypothetical protein
MSEAPRFCPWCQRPTRPIWVHGHAQCEHCKINIEPCCSGDETIPARADDPDEGLS